MNDGWNRSVFLLLMLCWCVWMCQPCDMECFIHIFPDQETDCRFRLWSLVCRFRASKKIIQPNNIKSIIRMDGWVNGRTSTPNNNNKYFLPSTIFDTFAGYQRPSGGQMTSTLLPTRLAWRSVWPLRLDIYRIGYRLLIILYSLQLSLLHWKVSILLLVDLITVRFHAVIHQSKPLWKFLILLSLTC